MPYVDHPLPEDLDLPSSAKSPVTSGLKNLRYGPGTGRAKGATDKISRDLKEGIIEGAVLHGYDGEGEGGLIGYCHHLAERHPKAYCGLLAKILPYNVHANVGGARIGSVNILSVPTDHYLSSEDAERLRVPARIEPGGRLVAHGGAGAGRARCPATAGTEAQLQTALEALPAEKFEELARTVEELACAAGISLPERGVNRAALIVPRNRREHACGQRNCPYFDCRRPKWPR